MSVRVDEAALNAKLMLYERLVRKARAVVAQPRKRTPLWELRQALNQLDERDNSDPEHPRSDGSYGWPRPGDPVIGPSNDSHR